MASCSKCGAVLIGSGKFCASCGAPAPKGDGKTDAPPPGQVRTPPPPGPPADPFGATVSPFTQPSANHGATPNPASLSPLQSTLASRTNPPPAPKPSAPPQASTSQPPQPPVRTSSYGPPPPMPPAPSAAYAPPQPAPAPAPSPSWNAPPGYPPQPAAAATPNPYAQPQQSYNYNQAAQGRPPASPSAYGAPPYGAFGVGARVLVLWADGNRYGAIVQQVAPGRSLVAFPDGRQLWVENQYLSSAV